MPKSSRTTKASAAKGKAPAQRANNARAGNLQPPNNNANNLLVQAAIAITLASLIANSAAVNNLKTVYKRSSVITDLVAQLMGVTSPLPSKWHEEGPRVVPLFVRELDVGLSADEADTALRGDLGIRAHFIFTARVGTQPTIVGAIPAQLVLAEHQPECESVGGTKAGLIALGVQETYLCEIVPNLATKGNRLNVFARSEIKVFTLSPLTVAKAAPRIRKNSQRRRDQLESEGTNGTTNGATDQAEDEEDSDGDSLSDDDPDNETIPQNSGGTLSMHSSAGGESMAILRAKNASLEQRILDLEARSFIEGGEQRKPAHQSADPITAIRAARITALVGEAKNTSGTEKKEILLMTTFLHKSRNVLNNRFWEWAYDELSGAYSFETLTYNVMLQLKSFFPCHRFIPEEIKLIALGLSNVTTPNGQDSQMSFYKKLIGAPGGITVDPVAILFCFQKVLALFVEKDLLSFFDSSITTLQDLALKIPSLPSISVAHCFIETFLTFLRGFTVELPRLVSVLELESAYPKEISAWGTSQAHSTSIARLASDHLSVEHKALKAAAFASDGGGKLPTTSTRIKKEKKIVAKTQVAPIVPPPVASLISDTDKAANKKLFNGVCHALFSASGTCTKALCRFTHILPVGATAAQIALKKQILAEGRAISKEG